MSYFNKQLRYANTLRSLSQGRVYNKIMINKKGRPRLKRKINFNPKITYFKPQGVPVSILGLIELTAEELEAIRLKNIKKFDQRECAQKMNTSPATFQRILALAHEKIAIALVEGKALKIVNK
ncbi:MAG: hypothetical protein COU31_01115 [Candidatus Magasanikbacteria bacterium CG10_big_fil_rev_8_21_14_0_10_40_10]|uniref:UPF0251 protein COU31_01115 n=1 Tax=Candidatus Magasanikbacteria bacterium CG10_big_fil_rev_8_21_14_0_10_40_10 TaxID=1974648 RepID=A0A2M6W4N2_9BACT|nr:MAG: hypothetical protein COU31_01115 [Candidatus Magasanikbacteria bacterium CG10_big_fil_rev_8_21_14_0_10_40_10]